MRFLVFNRDRIERMKILEKHIVISVRDPESMIAELPENRLRLGELFLAFSDIDRKIKHPKAILFTPVMAQHILTFFNRFKDKVELIVVNCEAGISRSPAIAGALAYILEEDSEEFFKLYIPNKFVYKTILSEHYIHPYCECKLREETLYLDTDKEKFVKRCFKCWRKIK